MQDNFNFFKTRLNARFILSPINALLGALETLPRTSAGGSPKAD